MSKVKKPTLASKIDVIRKIIDSYPNGQCFSAEHLSVIAELTNTVLRQVTKWPNPTFPSDKRYLHVIAYDWPTPSGWSWRDAVRIAHSRDPAEAIATYERQRVTRALRMAIQSDLNDFRSAARPAVCANPICDSGDDLSTDHLRPPFSAIAREFLESNPSIELRPLPGSSDIIANEDVEAQWIAFHASRATYQLLCRRCNSAKGAR